MMQPYLLNMKKNNSNQLMYIKMNFSFDLKKMEVPKELEVSKKPKSQHIGSGT